MRRKLNQGYYQFEIDYLLPCDSPSYSLEVYFGKNRYDLGFRAGRLIIPTINIGVWQTGSFRFYVPNELDNKLDWITILADGTPLMPPDYDNYAAYMYLDDVHLYESPCTSCDPNGLISYNANILNFFSPNNDGVLDSWCVQNINNVSWYDMQIFNSNGVRERRIQGSDANGFENLSICWDGRDDHGNWIPNFSTFYVVTRLGNCGAQYTWLDSVFLVPNNAWDTTVHAAPNYVPPLFGLDTPPTHYRDLYLYGGIYWGQHDWYACEAIWLGDWGAPRVPYFKAGYTADLGMYATEGIYIDVGDTDFQLGSDIDIVPQHVQCCPQLRLAAPSPDSIEKGDTHAPAGLEHSPATTVETRQAIPFALHVYPQPATDALQISFSLLDDCGAMVSLMPVAGTAPKVLWQADALVAGDHTVTVSLGDLPSGLYLLTLTHGDRSERRNVVIQR